MPNLHHLLSELAGNNITLQLDDNGNLKLRGEKQGLTAEIVEQIKQNKTLLVNWLKSKALRESIDNLEPIAQETEFTPLSYSQQRLWFIDKMEGTSAQYNMPLAMEIAGNLNTVALEQAIDALIEFHQILRTTYSENEGVGYQRVRTQWQFSLDIADYSDVKILDTEIANAVQQEAQAPFDLANDLAIRAKLLRTAQDNHVLLLTLHHIAADGWSLNLIMRDLVDFYQQFSLEGKLTAELPKVQYRDFAIWQRNHVSESMITSQIEYWQDKLKGIPQVHSLPTDFIRPTQPDFQGGSVKTLISRSVLTALESLAKQHDATLFMLMQVAFSLLVGRWSNERDIVIGSPTAGRLSTQLDDMVGFFVNNIVCRTELTKGATFIDLLAQGKNNSVEALSNQDVPFEVLVDAIAPKRSNSHAPIFQIVFSLRNHAEQAPELDNLKITGLDSGFTSVKVDLELIATETENGLELNWVYAKSLFSNETIENMAMAFETLLLAVIREPNADIDMLTLASPDNIKMVEHWNKTHYQWPNQTPVHHSIEQVASQYGDKIAIVDGEARISYQSLNDTSNQLAHYLVNEYVLTNKKIGVCGSRSANFILTCLAVLKSGCSFVPIDKTYPQERISYIAENSGIDVLIHISNDAKSFNPDLSCAQCVLDELNLTLYSKENLAVEMGEQWRSLSAYLIFTSGTTGRPKGVVNSHGALSNLCAWYHADIGVTESSVASHLLSVGFDAALGEIWPYLTAGAKIVVVSEEQRLNTESMTSLIGEQSITNLCIPSGLLDIYMESGVCNTTGIDVVITGGDRLTHSQIRGSNARLYNQYGPTEAGIVTTCYLASADKSEQAPPIGKPIPNVKTFILNQHGEEQPIGAIGELCIGGANLAIGYHNDCELTAQKFIQHAQYGRLYKTGDLARFNLDGNLVFVGRVDDQVKLRGFRIELAEIESLVKELVWIKEAVVLIQGEQQQKTLACFAVTVENSVASEQDLQAILRKQLPDYMVPDGICFLAKLPKTTNGKVDKAALPILQNEAQLQTIAPATPTEILLSEIWQHLLAKPINDVHTSFFHLGGNSLIAMQLISQIETQFARKLNIKSIFEHDSLYQQALLIEQQAKTEQLIIPVADESSKIPLAFAQHRLWLFDQLQGDSVEYNIPLVLKLSGALDLGALQVAINNLLDRHQILRTVYRSEGETVYQEILPHKTLCIDMEIVEDMDEFQIGQRVKQRAKQEALKPFNLSSDLMLRTSLLQINSSEFYLFFTIHHIATDGWSMSILTKEFMACYKSALEHQPCQLEPLPIQYKDYACWQHNVLNDQKLVVQEEYWKNKLADAPNVHQLPLDYARPSVQQLDGKRVFSQLSKTLFSDIDAYCQEHNVTMYALLESVLALTLSKWSGEQDIVIGSPVAGRANSQLESLIGYFTNTLAIRTSCDDKHTFEHFVQNNQQNILDGFDAQELPFDRVVEILNVERTTAYTPIYQIMFSLQNQEITQIELPGLLISGVESEHEVVKLDLNVSSFIDDGELNISWSFNAAIFESATIERLAKSFEFMLTQGIKNADKSIADFSAVPPEEKAVIKRLCSGRTLNVEDVPLHALIQQTCMESPNKVAIVCSKKTLTYAMLERESNQVANYLLEQGLLSNERVGIFMTKSCDQLVAMLAVMKAGAAYIPLDIKNTASRLNKIANNADVKILLCDAAIEPVKAQLDASLTLCFPSDIKDSSCDSIKTLLVAKQKQPAYVIYTSGTTGEPKGVVINHNNLVDYLTFAQSEYYHGELAGSLLVTSPAFDISVPSLFLPLIAGDTVCLLDNDREIEQLAERLTQPSTDGGYLLRMTPMHVRGLLQFLQDKPSVDSKHMFVVGGERFDVELAKQLQQCFPNSILYNHYGPTEATVGCAIFNITENLQHLETYIPIGKPMHNTELLVLDKNKNLLPIGVTGELFIGGAGVAQGYTNNPVMTEYRFQTLAGLTDNFGIFYQSGDLVRLKPDGNLEFVGRNDEQVKIRGYRIEIGEIENALNTLPFIDKACVRAVTLEDEKTLVGYYVNHSYASKDNVELLDHALITTELLKLLPDYMVPKRFVALDKFPLLSNGKINKKALPIPEIENLTLPQVNLPESQQEIAIAAVWREILKKEQLSVDDNFYAVGGDSMRAIPVVVQLRKKGFNLQIQDIFATPTIKQLAEKWLAQTTETCSQLTEIEPFSLLTKEQKQRALAEYSTDNVEDIYPMTQLQQGMVFHNLVAMEQGTYHDLMSLEIKQSWDGDAFKSALKALSDKHPILRTVFDIKSELPLQIVLKSLVPQLLVEDISHLNGQQQKQHVNQYISDVRKVPFNPKLPAWKIKVHVLSAGRFQYTRSVHHAMLDGWSAASFNTELFNDYLSRVNNATQQQTDSAVPLPYKYFVKQELQALEDKSFQSKWLTKLDDVSLPWWSGSEKSKSLTKHLNLGAKVSQQVLSLANNCQVQERSVFLAAHLVMMQLLSGTTDITTSVVANGRPEYEGGDKTLGLFLNSLPFRLNTHNKTWRELIVAINTELLEIGKIRAYPLSQIQRDTGLDFSSSIFNYVNFHIYQNLDQELEILGGESMIDKNYLYSIAFSKVPIGDETDFRVAIQVEDTIFDQQALKEIEGYLHNILSELVNNTDERIVSDNLISSHAMQSLLLKGVPCRAVEENLLGQIMAQAKISPHETAIEFADEFITYNNLITKVEQVAYSLYKKGVRHDDNVVVCLDRSVELMVSLLAAWRVGASYVPVAANTPVNRLKDIVADCDAKLIISLDAEIHDVFRNSCWAFDHHLLDNETLNADLLPRVSNDMASMAYVIYTSGTTGKPKGVPVSQGALCRYINFALDHYYGQHLNGSLVLTSHAFDLVIPSLFLPLLNGDRVVLLDAIDPLKEAVERLRKPSGDYLVRMTPMVAESLLNLIGRKTLVPQQHCFVIGGEAFPVSLGKDLRESFNNTQLFNHYGPTETVIGTTIFDVSSALKNREIDDSLSVFPIGKPMPGTCAYITNEHGELVTKGIPGELNIGGHRVTSGYLNQPELTREKFVYSPYIEQRVYKTADKVMLLPCGNLAFLGRKDSQVKIRGFRVELADVKHAIDSCVHVTESILTVSTLNGQDVLVAYLVLTEDGESDTKKLRSIRQYLFQRLPEYMVPGCFTVIDKVPLNANGKIDKSVLPMPILQNTQHVISPKNEVEAQLLDIWKILLKQDEISCDANFFEIGGHSLLATQMAGMIQEQFAVEVNLVEVLENPYIDELAKTLAPRITAANNLANLTSDDELVEMEW